MNIRYWLNKQLVTYQGKDHYVADEDKEIELFFDAISHNHVIDDNEKDNKAHDDFEQLACIIIMLPNTEGITKIRATECQSLMRTHSSVHFYMFDKYWSNNKHNKIS